MNQHLSSFSLLKGLGILILFLATFSFPSLHAQTDTAESTSDIMKQALRIYLDCSNCDEQFIRTEMKFVNFVRDRYDAQVHILVSRQTTGSGGREYTITFIGKERFLDDNDTLVYNSQKTDTDEMTRNGLLKSMKLGLMKYVAKTPLAEKLSITFTESGKEQEKVKDSWDYWVFSLRINGNINADQNNSRSNIYGNISANRTTADWKLSLSTNLNENTSRSDYYGDIYESYSGSKSLYALVVSSINDNWSAGISGSVSSATYNNLFLSFYVAPAIEYDLFPYSESTRRQLRILQRIGYTYRNYREETIYDKTTEHLFDENFEIALELKQEWGTINTSVEGSVYLHDFSKNRIQVWGGVSIRVFEGLSFNIDGFYTRQHDQLSIRKGQASLQDVLLQRQQIESGYEYYSWFGLSYTFGSIYNNIVNPRFGN